MDDALEKYLKGEENWANDEIPNDDYLGDAIEVILDTAYPQDPRPEFPPGPHYLPLKVLLLGPLFAGKKTQQKKLTELYGVKVYDMNQIEEDAKKVIDQKNAPEDPKKKKGQEEESPIFVEASLQSIEDPHTRKASLFRAKIRGILGDQPPVEEEVKKPTKKEEVKCQGLCLLGFPTNLGEAKALEYELSHFVHSDDLPEPIASIKKREATILAIPTPKPPSATQSVESFFDIIVWLDLSLEDSLLRGLDRRIDPAGNIYNMNINPPPDNLLAKCKPIEKPTQEEITAAHEVYAAHKEDLLKWFSIFGKPKFGWSSFEYFAQGTTLEEVTETVLQKAKEVVEMRNNPPDETEKKEIVVFRDTELELTQENALSLANEWETLKSLYLANLQLTLSKVDSHFSNYVNILSECSQEFLAFLARFDDKKEIAESFYVNLKHNLAHGKRLFGDQMTRFNTSVEDLLNGLWDIIDFKKDESIAYREKLMQSDSIENELKGLLALTKELLDIELAKYYSVYNLLGKFHAFTSEFEFNEAEPAVLTIDWELPIEHGGHFPVLDSLINHAKQINDDFEWTQQAKKELFCRIGIIENWTRKSLVFYREKNDELFLVMDEWIKDAVRFENQMINQFAGKIKKAVHEFQDLEDIQFPDNEEILTVLSQFSAT